MRGRKLTPYSNSDTHWPPSWQATWSKNTNRATSRSFLQKPTWETMVVRPRVATEVVRSGGIDSQTTCQVEANCKNKTKAFGLRARKNRDTAYWDGGGRRGAGLGTRRMPRTQSSALHILAPSVLTTTLRQTILSFPSCRGGNKAIKQLDPILSGS